MKLNGFFQKLTSTSAVAFLGLILSSSIQTSQATEFVLNTSELQAMTLVSPLNVINWKVGDSMSYQVSMGFFGKMGTSVKSVSKDEGDSIWIHQELNLSVQKEVIDIQLSKADGKVLKMIRNGKEMQMPDDKLEIISQDYAEVTVPAGKFQAIHILAKSTQSSKIELWANPSQTAMDGGLKQIVATQFGDLTMELTSFKRN
ncbi:MAG: hypothetical protein RJB38_1013 [Pseudomonadota bacterium]|jgi:hypothetical protein